MVDTLCMTVFLMKSAKCILHYINPLDVSVMSRLEPMTSASPVRWSNHLTMTPLQPDRPPNTPNVGDSPLLRLWLPVIRPLSEAKVACDYVLKTINFDKEMPATNLLCLSLSRRSASRAIEHVQGFAKLPSMPLLFPVMVFHIHGKGLWHWPW